MQHTPRAKLKGKGLHHATGGKNVRMEKTCERFFTTRTFFALIFFIVCNKCHGTILTQVYGT